MYQTAFGPETNITLALPIDDRAVNPNGACHLGKPQEGPIADPVCRGFMIVMRCTDRDSVLVVSGSNDLPDDFLCPFCRAIRAKLIQHKQGNPDRVADKVITSL